MGGTGGDGRHRRASKRVSDATTRRLFDHDPLFAVLRALDAFATPSAPVREELVFAALAIPLAIRAVGWPRLPERVPESLKHAAGGSRRLHLAGHSWRRLDAELARYDAWWRSLPPSERASSSAKKTPLNETADDAWVADWCFWSAAAASAQLALRDYSPSTRGVLFDSFALTHLPALTTQRGATDKDARRRRGRERSNDENVVIELSDADFRRRCPRRWRDWRDVWPSRREGQGQVPGRVRRRRVAECSITSATPCASFAWCSRLGGCAGHGGGVRRGEVRRTGRRRRRGRAARVGVMARDSAVVDYNRRDEETIDG